MPVDPTDHSIRPGVSFIVIAFNEEAGIANTIASIVAQDACNLLEIVVVDDASRDGTAGVVARLAEADRRVRLISHEQNRGRGAARHRGFQGSRGDEVAYIDADIVLPADWYQRCARRLREEDLDAVGGVAIPDGDVGFLYRRFGLEPKVVASTTTVTGNNGLYRRSVFEKITFDPNLREGEDIAFNHAVNQLNARMETITDLHVRHEERKSFWTSVAWLYESGIGATRMLYRYRQVRVPDLATGLWLLAVTRIILRRRHRARELAAPVVIAGAAATSHVNRSFVLQARRPWAALGAVAVDTVFLTAYFVGRVVGVKRLSARG